MNRRIKKLLAALKDLDGCTLEDRDGDWFAWSKNVLFEVSWYPAVFIGGMIAGNVLRLIITGEEPETFNEWLWWWL